MAKSEAYQAFPPHGKGILMAGGNITITGPCTKPSWRLSAFVTRENFSIL